MNGIYDKFFVSRFDGKSAVGEKHHNCRYFVLDLDHDKHAVPALQAYVDSLHASGENFALQKDLEAVAGAAYPGKVMDEIIKRNNIRRSN